MQRQDVCHFCSEAAVVSRTEMQALRFRTRQGQNLQVRAGFTQSGSEHRIYIDVNSTVDKSTLPMKTTLLTHPPRATPSATAVAGHPIHPMLITFPVAYLLAALASDGGIHTGLHRLLTPSVAFTAQGVLGMHRSCSPSLHLPIGAGLTTIKPRASCSATMEVQT